MELPFDPVIPLLGLHPKDPETPIKQNLYKQNPETVVYLQSGILCSSKKEGTLTFCESKGDLETIMLSEISQSMKDKYHMISPIRGT